MKHEESKLQQVCVKWFKLQHRQHVIFAIPNGGAREYIAGAILKAEGTLAGVADLFVMHASKEWHGLFIEMKTADGKQTSNQALFQALAQERGYKYMVCRTLDEFMTCVNEYLT